MANSIGAYAQGGSNEIGAYEYAASGTQYTETDTTTGTGTVALSFTIMFAEAFSTSGTGTSVLTRLHYFVESLSTSGVGTAVMTKILTDSPTVFKAIEIVATGTVALTRVIRKKMETSGTGLVYLRGVGEAIRRSKVYRRMLTRMGRIGRR